MQNRDFILFIILVIQAINEQILSCDYENTTFEVLSIDSQSSLEDGVFIMVIGFLTGKDKLKRKFSQMFYLARQNHKYDVLNDIFRYVDEEDSTPKTLPVLEPGKLLCYFSRLIKFVVLRKREYDHIDLY